MKKIHNKILPVVLSGGSGTRLWPLSRELYPKQLLPLTGERTMIQNTVTRLEGIADLGPPLIVCNESHRFMVAEQMRLINVRPSAVVLEPVGRNTAPAVAIAALQAMKGGDDPVLLVLPADHVIKNVTAFSSAVTEGARLAENGSLITFGIVPDKPETGYGYIKKGQTDKNCSRFEVKVQSSVNKRVQAPALNIEHRTSITLPLRSTGSKKSLIRQRRRNSSHQESISGTAACLCSGHPDTSRSSNVLRRTSSLPAGRPSRGLSATLISPGSTRRPLQPAGAIRSTMRSWKRPTLRL